MTERVAVVTGGMGGIGTEICKALANSGHKVAATYLPNVEEGEAWQAKMKEEGFEFAITPVDVTDFDQCAEMVKDVEGKLGTIDVLVNCAGITRDGFFHKMDKANWGAVLSTNLDSVFNVTRNVYPGMRDRGYGRIVNISSVNGQKGQFGQANYSAAKAGMHGFTMALAQEGAKKGVTVNTISPGYINTAMVGKMKPEIVQQMVDQIPVGRLGEPAEIARVVAFLAEEGSGFITGADLSINGGMYMS